MMSWAFYKLIPICRKSEFFDDPDAAKANLRDARDRLHGGSFNHDRISRACLPSSANFRRLLQTAPKDPQASRLRWVLKYLTNRSERRWLP